ncbi:MAG: hypothetical protein CMB65_02870 [Euryarchaeota archaeon]|nr:hypothetical protein [Euryarchaeota archaeon]|tara:strand:- start:185 stop:406 length:222 start_codon:yes stop_codon:yes gene_type:complete
MTVEAKAGDSLQVLVSDEGKIELSYDKNDPHWGWLAKCSDDELQEFITLAIASESGEQRDKFRSRVGKDLDSL